MVKYDFLCNFIIIVHIFSLNTLYIHYNPLVSVISEFSEASTFCLVTCAHLCVVLQFTNLISIKVCPGLYHGIIEYPDLGVTLFSHGVQILAVRMTT